MSGVAVILICLLALGAGIIVLQIFLSKKESKWAGLILPIITFLISIVAVLGIAVFSVMPGATEVIVENGVEIQQALPGATTSQPMGTGALIATIAYVLLLYNIPTAVLLAIYAACRGKRKMQKALDKMNVQDLE